MDVIAEDKEYRLVLDVPGASKEDVSVEAGPIPGTVLVRVEPSEASLRTPKGTPVRVERAASRPGGVRLERIVPVAPDADGSGAKVSLKDGVLTVTVPKRAPASEQGVSGSGSGSKRSGSN